MQPDALIRDLEDAAQRLQDARDHLVAVMLRARDAGLSLREIADHVGVSHETVRAMLTRQDS